MFDDEILLKCLIFSTIFSIYLQIVNSAEQTVTENSVVATDISAEETRQVFSIHLRK